MPRITLDLLRKRADHNEGMISTLEEISLHQQDIEKIEVLEKHCRHLKILYLQSNLIGKMEGLNKLKELEYVNFAVNNISKIENIRGCESLAKLDLTLNFIEVEDLEESMNNLAECSEIKELYLTGNPCTHWEHYKDYVIAKVPQMRRLDGEELTKSVKILAKQRLGELEAKLRETAKESKEKKQKEIDEGTVNEDAYTKEYRVKMYTEMEEKKQKDEAASKENNMFKDFNEFDKANKRTEPPSVYNHFGEVRQCNEGKYDFKFSESDDKVNIVLEVAVPKFMDTSLVNIDLNPTYIRMDIKGSITQLKFNEDIIVSKSKVQRSTTTGILVLTCPKANLSDMEAAQRVTKLKEERMKAEKLKELELKQRQAKQQQESSKKSNSNTNKDDFLIKESQKEEEGGSAQRKDDDFTPDFDIDDVPPLE